MGLGWSDAGKDLEFSTSTNGLLGEQAGSKRLRVKVLNQLAQGGFSLVYSCVAVEDGKTYAVKQMLCQTDEHESDALKEIRIHKALGGANPPRHILPLLGSQVSLSKSNRKVVSLLYPMYKRGSVQDMIYSLRSKPEEGHPSIEFLESIALGLARGLKTLHSRGIAHYDVKLGNVLLDDENNPVLIDFGSCEKVMIKVSTRKQALEIMEKAEQKSSAAFRAPELWDVASDCILNGASLDIWSLGCSIYAMTFGQGFSPFEDPIQGLQVLGIRNCKVKYPSNSRYLATSLHRVIQGTVVLDSNRRFTIEQVITASPLNRVK